MTKDYYGYVVYSEGKVFSKKLNRFLKQSTTRLGYKQVTLKYPGGKSKIWKVHRLVAYCFCEPPNNWENLQVNHKDGNKKNNDYSNLEWCSAWYNNYHARKIGLNNVSDSNKKRWQDPAFRAKACKNMKIANLDKHTREHNSEWRYDIRDKQGNVYTRKELSILTNLALSSISRIIREAAHGKEIPCLTKFGIIVKDVKRER